MFLRQKLQLDPDFRLTLASMGHELPAPLRRIAALAALSLTLLPAAAAAQTPSDEGYEADGPTVQNQVESGDSPQARRHGKRRQTRATRATRANPATTPRPACRSRAWTWGCCVAAGALLVGVGAGMRLLLKLPPPVR